MPNFDGHRSLHLLWDGFSLRRLGLVQAKSEDPPW